MMLVFYFSKQQRIDLCKTRIVLFFFIQLFGITITNVKASKLVFENITTKHGLSQNNINCILQDSHGFMWFGTDDGLNRFDGYEFKTFRIIPDDDSGLNSNLIRCLKEDDENNIWIGTTDRGFCIFNYSKEKITRVVVDSNNTRFLSDEGVFDISSSNNGDMWLLTEKKIFILDTRHPVYKQKRINNKQYLEFDGKILRCMLHISENETLIGTVNGLYLCSETKSGGYSIEFFDYTKSMNFNDIKLFNGGVAISGNGCLLFMDKNYKIYYISGGSYTCLGTDSSGFLWAGTTNGLIKYTGRDSGKPLVALNTYNDANTSNGLPGNHINEIYINQPGIIWSGSKGKGITKIHNQEKKFEHYKLNIQSQNQSKYNIRAILEDSERNVWMGTNEVGISLLRADSRNYNSDFVEIDIRETPSRYLVLYETNFKNSKYVISGTQYPLNHKAYRIVNNKVQANNLPGKLGSIDEIICSYESAENMLWIGTYGHGLYRYSKDNDSLICFMPGRITNISSKIVRSLLYDSKQRLWIGTDKGLNMLEPGEQLKNNPSFTVFKNNIKDKQSISHDYILPMLETKKKEVWVGTFGGGLNKFIEESNSFRRLSTNNGLPNNTIKGILEDENENLWISSNRGLSKITLVPLKIINFDITDGLQDYEYSDLSCCKRYDGEMLFGGVNGFNAFYPSAIKQDTTLPNIVFIELQVLNQTIKPGKDYNGRIILEKCINETKHIKLKYKESSFVLFFTALHYVAPHKIRYKYKLENFDNEWIETSSQFRFSKYTRLLPGEYYLKILATNSDGIWMKNPRELKITIVRPWWLNNYAIIVYVATLISLLIFFRKYSVINIKMKNALMMERFEKEKRNELTQIKLRFFTNISHEFRTPLTLILSYLDKLKAKKKEMEYQVEEKDFSIIYRNANVLLRLVNQLMDFRKLEQGKMRLEIEHHEFIELATTVKESFNALAEANRISFHLKTGKKAIYFQFDVDKMEKILNNVLSNAFKYTHAGGEVGISIQDDEHLVTIKVIDSGIGIPEEQQQYIFDRFYQVRKENNSAQGGTGIGLSYTKGLVELHNGEIRCESIAGEGTCFTLVFPKVKGDILEPSVSGVKEELKKEANNIHKQEREEESLEIVTNIEKDLNTKVLVVEDHTELLNHLYESLSEYFVVVKAENGAIGLKKCIIEQPDIIISDVMMPEMTGYEMCRELKNDIRISHIPVILLTAKISIESQIQGFNEGADAYVSKPFSMDVLVARINAIKKSRENMIRKINEKPTINPSEVTTTLKDEKFLNEIMCIIEKNIPDPRFTVEQLAKEYDISKITLNKKIKALTGITPKLFIRSVRLKRAAQLLAGGKYQVAEVTFEVGFNSLRHFRESFREEYSVTPSEYKSLNQHSQPDK